MKRSRNLVVTCHCILNCNSKVEGLAEFEGAHHLASSLINNSYGIIQLPCPEMIIYGIKRWGHVKEQFDNMFFRDQCRIMLEPYIKQFDSYLKSGYDIKGIIAIDGSPSCGYNKTCSSSRWCGEMSGSTDLDERIKTVSMIEGKGVFIEELEKLLLANNLNIPFIGLDESLKDVSEVMDKLK